MIKYLRIFKRSVIWKNILDYFVYPFYSFVWSYLINFHGKILYFFWVIKKNEYFFLNNNDKLIVKNNSEFTKLANEIYKEVTPKLIDKYQEILFSKEYSEYMKKHNKAVGEIPYSISIYKDLSLSLKKRIVEFASNDKMVSTATNYMKIFPILTRIQVLLNIPRENSGLRGPMLWHKDGFGFKNLDFFMNVTDVNEDNGPFYCVDEKIRSGVFKSFNNFYSKTGERNKVPMEEFDKIFGNKKILNLKGESGTAMFLDSFSTYHRGGFCKKNHRIMLRFCYQSQDAICDRFNSKEDKLPFYPNITKLSLNDKFKHFLFFKKPNFFVVLLKRKLLQFYSLIEYKYTNN